MIGAPYFVDAGSVRNQFLVRMVNKRAEPARFVLSIRRGPPGIGRDRPRRGGGGARRWAKWSSRSILQEPRSGVRRAVPGPVHPGSTVARADEFRASAPRTIEQRAGSRSSSGGGSPRLLLGVDGWFRSATGAEADGHLADPAADMEFAAVNSPAAAFVAGLVTSLHCAGMCGPLACAIMPVRGERTDGQTVGHGLSCRAGWSPTRSSARWPGGSGGRRSAGSPASALRWLPWLLVLFFVGLALRWDRHLPETPGPRRASTWRLRGRLRGRSRLETAAALGLATPLLPCGPLYFLLALALLSGSALRGAEFMLAFGLGTVPLLWLAQIAVPVDPRRGSRRLWLGRLRIGPRRCRRRPDHRPGACAATLGFAGPDPGVVHGAAS